MKLARLLALLFAIFAGIVIIVLWKGHDRRAAIRELEERYEAQVYFSEGDTGDEFYIGCSSPLLQDLENVANLARRIGKLTTLDLTGAPNLKSLAGVSLLPELRSLRAFDCPALVSAEGVAGLSALRELIFTESAALVDTKGIRDLASLVTLDLSGCRSIRTLEADNLPELQNLYLSRCQSLIKLDVASFPTLQQLSLDGSETLEELIGLEKVAELTDLNLSDAKGLKTLPRMDSLSKLVVLDLQNVGVSALPEFGLLPALRVLRMGGQEEIRALEAFSQLSSLRELHLENCPNLVSLRGIPAGLSQYAGFTNCPKLTSLAGIEAATGLEQLDLNGCSELNDVSALSSLSNLVQLNLMRCGKVSDVSVVEGLSKLVIVMLGGSGVEPDSVKSIQEKRKELIMEFALPE